MRFNLLAKQNLTLSPCLSLPLYLPLSVCLCLCLCLSLFLSPTHPPTHPHTSIMASYAGNRSLEKMKASPRTSGKRGGGGWQCENGENYMHVYQGADNFLCHVNAGWQGTRFGWQRTPPKTTNSSSSISNINSISIRSSRSASIT